MRLPVSATRMQMMRLKKRLAVARRGHKLLKDKQEELMRQIMGLIDEIREHRGKVEKETGRILGRFAVARNAYPPEFLDEAVMLPTKKVTVEVTTRNILNIKVPVRVYDRLFNQENPDKAENYLSTLNPESLQVTEALAEPSLFDAKPGETFQFERVGYFTVDSKDSQGGAPVFNRTVTLRDTWAKVAEK